MLRPRGALRKRLFSEAGGETVKRRIFEPFGELFAQSSDTEFTPRLFTGQQYEPTAGLYDFRARWYDAETGRFLSVDPIVQDVADPQTHNAYGYVRNNPMNGVDPDGLGFVKFLKQLAIGLVSSVPVLGQFVGCILMMAGAYEYGSQMAIAGIIGGTISLVLGGLGGPAGSTVGTLLNFGRSAAAGLGRLGTSSLLAQSAGAAAGRAAANEVASEKNPDSPVQSTDTNDSRVAGPTTVPPVFNDAKVKATEAKIEAKGLYPAGF